MHSLNECNWPDISGKYLTALKEAVKYIFSNYNSVVGIIAAGTIIRGCPDNASDLDIYVIHLDKYRQRVQKYFNKVPCELFINPPSIIEWYFEDEKSSDRALTAHMLHTGEVIFKTNPVVDDLRKKSEKYLSASPKNPENLTMQKYSIATLFEDAMDVYRADKATSRMILSQAVEKMLQYAFTKAGKNIPRSKDLLQDLYSLDKEIAKSGNLFFKTDSFKKQIKAANNLADKILETRGFFEWQSEPENVD